MGSNSGQDCERPIHRVWIDRFPARRHASHQRRIRPLPHATTAPPLRHSGDDPNFNHPQQPVAGVSWHEATALLRMAEFANRPRRIVCPPKPNGSSPPAAASNKSNFPGATTRRSLLPDYATRWQTGPEPVARYAPNAFGLYDIGDNVHEWCSDWYDPNYYAISPDRNPQGPEHKPHEAAAQILPRRLLAPPHQSVPLLRPLQHPPGIPIRRLRLPRRLQLVALASHRCRECVSRSHSEPTHRCPPLNLSFRTGHDPMKIRCLLPSSATQGALMFRTDLLKQQAHPHHRRRHRPRQRHGPTLPRTRSHGPHLRPPRKSSRTDRRRTVPQRARSKPFPATCATSTPSKP